MDIIVSVNHDIADDDCDSGEPFEIKKGGWYRSFLLGVSKNYKVISIHPTRCNYPIIWRGENFAILKWPTDIGRQASAVSATFYKLGIDLRIENLSLRAYRVARKIAEKASGIIYLHEFRRKAGAYIALKEFKDIPLILQQHSSKSPRNLSASSFARRAYWTYVNSSIRSLKKAVIFALSEEEKRYFEKNYPNVRVYLRPMFVDYNKLKPPSEEEKVILRQKWGFKNDEIIILTYGGSPNYRGIQYLHILRKILNRNDVKFVVAGLPTEWILPLRKRNIVAFPRLNTDDYYELLRLSDVYLLLLSSALKPLGISVSAMEAFAVGLPVISPSLIHFPEKNKIERIGRIIPYVDKLSDIMKILPILSEALDFLSYFNRSEIRQLTSKYYSLESFIETIDMAIKYLEK